MKPVLSIITITYNNLSGLKKTLQSVADQSFSDYEHLIIDGDSNDGTKEFLSSYTNHLIHCYSEKDEGIYNAMNKGLSKAKGRWIIFMNAADGFSQDVLSKVDFNTNADVMYGNSLINYSDKYNRVAVASDISSLWKGMSFTHQSVFAKTSLLVANPFKENFKFCADFDQLFSLYKQGSIFQQLALTICEIEAGGISDLKRYKATTEVYQINRILEPKLLKHPYFIAKIVWGFIVTLFKRLMPKKLALIILKKKYK